MSRLDELALLARQLTAHRGYLARRAIRELTAKGLVRAGEHVPGAARAASRLLPNAPEPRGVLARLAEARGDAVAAAEHAAEHARLSHNTLEPSVLPVLRAALGRRTAEPAPDPAAPFRALLDAGDPKAAHTWLEASDLPTGARIDALLVLAEAASSEADAESARALLERARELDGGRSEPLRALGAWALRAGDDALAARHFRAALDLDPRDTAAWVGLGDALRAEPEHARAAWERALARDPDSNVALRRLAGEGTGSSPGRVVLLREASGPFEVGTTVGVELRAEVGASGGALYLLVPFGGGLSCEPAGRLVLDPGSHRLDVEVRVRRPDAVNAGTPWRLRAALCAGGEVHRAQLDFVVPDREPGVLYHIITEDHELYDERESTDPEAARTTLVSKSALGESIANRAGARWTHMVDVGSLALVDWAAEQRPEGAWPETARACREHLVEAVAAGNDLGLHLHAFHDPALPGFCHALEPDGDRIVTDPEFLDASITGRGFWSRAFPALGDVEKPGTRAWATWRGIGHLEALGRLGDPRFRVALFRAGSYDFGVDGPEAGRSIGLLERLGVLADSDVPKPRLCHRPLDAGTYPISDRIDSPSPTPADTRLLEVRAEYNVEGDFLCDAGVLDRYVEGRVAASRDSAGGTRPGVHVICAMSHDKFINWRMGGAWDSLDPQYGDWATIRSHLEHVARLPPVRFATAREAVLAWYDRYAPALVAWRDAESVVLSAPGAERETYRYAVRLLGRDVVVSPDRPEPVRVTLPAWLYGRIRHVRIERNRRPWESRRLRAGLPVVEFTVDDRRAEWELVVEADAGSGVECCETTASDLRLASKLHYRAARLELPAALAPDGEGRRFACVAFAPAGTGYEARVSLEGGHPIPGADPGPRPDRGAASGTGSDPEEGKR